MGERLGPDTEPSSDRVDARRASSLIALAVALALPAVAHADMDDVRVPVPAPDALFGPRDGMLSAGAGSADLAVYPVQGRGHHRWHGRLRGDVAIAQIDADSLVRLGLSVQTVADDRNEIAFRLVRVYYDAFTGYEHRLGDGVAYAGYRHRCSHGADTAVDGRVLIRSGPELGYRMELSWKALSMRVHGFGHASLIAQNDDVRSFPRALLGLAGELRYRQGWASWLLGAGLGAALLSHNDDWTATLGDPWQRPRVELLPAATLGVLLHGQAADFRILAHVQRILDTGIGPQSDPDTFASLQLGFVY